MSAAFTPAMRAIARVPFLFVIVLAAGVLATGCGGSMDIGGGGSKSDSKTRTTETTDTADTPDTSDTSGGGSSDDAASGEGRFCNDDSDEETVAKRNDAFDSAPKQRLDTSTTYTVHMKTSKGTFDIVLDPKAGPIAAANFAYLVRNCFYDGIVFHRIIKNFMIQTGDPTGTGTGGPGYTIKDDDVEGDYARGVVAMANAGPDTGGSQFFIVQGADVQLPPDYAIFGSVDAKGMKVVDAIANTPVQESSSGEPSEPKETVAIKSATLDER